VNFVFVKKPVVSNSENRGLYHQMVAPEKTITRSQRYEALQRDGMAGRREI
jgi:hypothetical protein